MKRLAIAALALLLAGPALAQGKKIGGPVGHALDVIQGGQQQGSEGQPGGFLPGEKLVQNKPCDFSWIMALQAKNLGDQVRICDLSKLADDMQAAIDSATAFKDQPALACLSPAIAIVKAGIGTPLPVPADAPAGTLPAIKPPGLILLFQKFREFALSNGVASCKSYFSVTLAAGQPLGQ